MKFFVKQHKILSQTLKKQLDSPAVTLALGIINSLGGVEIKDVVFYHNFMGTCRLFDQPPFIFTAGNPLLSAINLRFFGKPAAGKNKTHGTFDLL